MRVGILGPLDVVVAGKSVPLGGARLRALLSRLALDAGRTVTVDALAEALWPDDRPADPGHALQSLVSRLRRAVPGELPVRSVPGGYRLDLPVEAVDVTRFERLLADGRRELDAGRPGTAAPLLRAALELWRGAPLADVADAPSVAATVARLDELRIAAIEDRIAADLAGGSADVVAELRELIAAHPFRERLRVLLLDALRAAGRRAEALTAYAQYREQLAAELGADPGSALRAAHLAVLREDDAPVTRSRGNLRAALTSFVGRDAERVRVAEQLATARLVTLVGPGGAGKTRLATTVAGESSVAAWLVELAGVSDPDDVVRAVAGALDLHDTALPGTPSRRDPLHHLVEALSGADTLLVLDNCEHVVDAAAHLAEELLGRCPRLRVLATSREPLGLTGEALCPVPPLPLPEPDADPGTSPAVRLFAERAAAARAGFALTTTTAPAVAEICRRLDGLPLAIELAAARLRAMPLDQLAARLDDRFRVLTGGSRTALARHRTLHAVVTWSWDLLADGERTAAERLAVFPASFAPEAAAYLGAGSETLEALVEKSLLQLVDGPEPRYRMLETIREYGLERLGQAEQVEQTRAVHAGYVLQLAERAAPHLRGFGQLPWIRRLAAERDNLLAAVQHACAAGDADTAARLGSALAWFWTVHGEHVEAAHRLRRILDVPGVAATAAGPDVAAGYLFNAVLADDPAARRAGELAAIARSAEPGHPAAAVIEALLALLADDTRAGLAAVDGALPHPDAWTRAMLWLVRSFLQGSHAGMGGMWHDLACAVAAFREAGERWGLSTALTYLAFAHSTFGAFDDAVAALEESMGLVRELGTDDSQRVLLAMVRIQVGDLDTARAELRAVVAAAGSATPVAMARISLAGLARWDGDLVEASRQLELVVDALGEDDALLRTARGKLAVARDDAGAAEVDLRVALELATGMPDLPMVAAAAVGVAQLAARRGAAASAAEVLGAAHALRAAPDASDPDVQRLAQDLCDRLGEPAYRAAYDRGRSCERAGALAVVDAALAAASRSAKTSRQPWQQNV